MKVSSEAEKEERESWTNRLRTTCSFPPLLVRERREVAWKVSSRFERETGKKREIRTYEGHHRSQGRLWRREKRSRKEEEASANERTRRGRERER